MTHSDASQKRFELGLLLLVVTIAIALAVQAMIASQGVFPFSHRLDVPIISALVNWAISMVVLKATGLRKATIVVFVVVWIMWLPMAAFTGILNGMG